MVDKQTIKDIGAAILACTIITLVIVFGLSLFSDMQQAWVEDCNKEHGEGNWTVIEEGCTSSLGVCYRCAYNGSGIRVW